MHTGLGAWRGAGAADCRPEIFCGSEWSCETTSAWKPTMPGTRVVSVAHSRSCSGFRGGRENPCPVAKRRYTREPKRERGVNSEGAGLSKFRLQLQGLLKTRKKKRKKAPGGDFLWSAHAQEVPAKPALARGVWAV